METKVENKKGNQTANIKEIGDFFGKLYSFNTTLKLYHWHITGKGSYAQHIALDQALDSLGDVLDRIVETSYAMYGDIDIVVPEAKVPTNIVEHCQEIYDYIKYERILFSEDFTESIIDDFHEAVQQLLYRLKRLQ